MDMYAVELGKNGPDGFVLVETSNMLASDRRDAEQRAVDMLRSRGVQIGAKALRLLGRGKDVVWQYP
jgi:hypothetical protein